MNFEMQKANMLANNINGFIKFVHKIHEEKNSFRLNTDKSYQIKLLIKEFKFPLIAEELLRVNHYDWDEKYTYLLVDEFAGGINVIDEYVKNNYNDLFLLAARLHTLKSLILSFSRN